MNEQQQFNDYFSDLSNMAREQDKARLRSLVLSFHSTLQRLPKLNQEIEAMLQSAQHLDYEELLKRVEPQLEKATHLLLELDMLSDDFCNASEMQAFMRSVETILTIRTVDALVVKFHQLQQEISQKIIQEKQHAERLATEKKAQEEQLAEEKEKQRLAAEREAKVLAVIKSIEFVKISAGSFKMGDNNDYPVTIPKDFYLGKYLVTQAQWQAVMGNNPANFKGDDLPVECVSWFDAQEFIDRLNAKTGLMYALPTDAEWEYACRAGTTTPYYTGKEITGKQANFHECVGCTTPVGTSNSHYEKNALSYKPIL